MAVVVLAVVAASLPALLPGPAGADSTTYANDALRTGWYPDQTNLTPSLVSGGTFGRMFSASVDGQVYAQPIVSNGTLLVATETDNVYGLDPSTGAVRWHDDLGTPFNAAEVNCPDLAPTVGVTGTPVVDAATHTAYLVAKRYVNGSSGPVTQEVHALDITNGAERPAFPVTIQGPADNDASVSFNSNGSPSQAATAIQRAGLLLLGGAVYVAFAGHCDRAPLRGWVFGVGTYGAARVGQITARFTSEAGQAGIAPGGGIWQSGSGLVSDGPGQILLATGNGNTAAAPTPGTSPPRALGQAVVRLAVQPDGTLAATDFFAPYDAASLNGWDGDFGAGGPVALPSFFGTPTTPHLLVQTGKEGYVYLLNRDALGGYQQGPGGGDAVVNRVGPDGGTWSKPAVWPGDGGYVYVVTASNGVTGGSSTTAGLLHAYRYGLDGQGKPTLSLSGTAVNAQGQLDPFGLGSTAGVVTSNATVSGSALLWSVRLPNSTGVGAQLRAYDPVPVNGQLRIRWSGALGTASKYTLPAVSGNRVYVGTREGTVLAFGSPVNTPMTAASPAVPAAIVGQSSYASVSLTATAALTVTRVTSSNPVFAVGATTPPLPASVARGALLTVPITFTPTSAGAVASTLTVTTSLGSVQIALTARGLSATPLLTASPALISFGAVAIGRQADASVVLTNDGAQPLTITTTTAPTTPAFSATGLPGVGAQLTSGQSVTVGVGFAPGSIGEVEDEIDVYRSDSAAALVVHLSGVGAEPPQLQISSLAVDAGGVQVGSTKTLSFTIANTGGSPLTITKSKPPIGGAFNALTLLNEGTEIDPGRVLTERVQFAPHTPGPAQSTWEITGDDGSGVQSIALTGSGTLPADNLQAYIIGVYEDLFHRPPDPGGLQFWTNALANGTPRGAVADSIVHSTEYESNQVAQIYQQFLGRAPDPGGWAFWVSRLAAGALTPELSAQIAGSDEYFYGPGLGTYDHFLFALYRDALHRNPDAVGYDFFATELLTGTPIFAVAYQMFFSTEALQNMVEGFYQSLLHRASDPGGLAYWVSRIQAGFPDQAVVTMIVASDEYFGRWTSAAGRAAALRALESRPG